MDKASFMRTELPLPMQSWACQHTSRVCQAGRWWIMDQERGLTEPRAGWTQFKTGITKEHTWSMSVPPRSLTIKTGVSNKCLTWLPSNCSACILSTHPSTNNLNREYWGKQGTHSCFNRLSSTNRHRRVKLSPLPSLCRCGEWILPLPKSERLLRGNCWIRWNPSKGL